MEESLEAQDRAGQDPSWVDPILQLVSHIILSQVSETPPKNKATMLQTSVIPIQCQGAISYYLAFELSGKMNVHIP